MKKLLYVFILLSTIGGYSGQTWTAEDSAFTERGLDSQFRKSIGELSSLYQPSVASSQHINKP